MLNWRRKRMQGGKRFVANEAFYIYLQNLMSFTPDQTSNRSFNSQKQDCFHEQSPDHAQNNEKLTSNNGSDLPNKGIKESKKVEKRKRGRPAKPENLNKGPKKPQTKEYLNQMHQRKVNNIIAYENALKKLRASCKQFYSPFEEHKLKLDRQAVIEVLTDALKNVKDRALRLRVAIRSVGVRHQRNLFKYGVREQLGYIIQYLETGKVPKEMKYQFRQLMEKDFSNVRETQMHPTLI